jgi:UDP-N-acetylmuramoyl-tripeptide--D-alanyl-D-alanine ligase
MVVLGLRAEHELGVVEIGTNSRGEIREGVRIAEPDVSILTLVAGAHGEGIGTLEDIAWEKGEIFAGLGTTGIAVVNGDDCRALGQVMRSEARESISYGVSENADLQIVRREAIGTRGQRLALKIQMANISKEIQVDVPLLGEAGAYASAAAIASGIAIHGAGLDWGAALRGLETIIAEEGRLCPKLLKSGVMVIDDCYNANPASMMASIRTASEIAGAEKRALVLVLGEMRELGESTIREHERVGMEAGRSGATRLIAVGGASKHLAEKAKGLGIATKYFETSQAAAGYARGVVGANDLVLVKGSRGVALEAVVAAFEAEGGKETV